MLKLNASYSKEVPAEGEYTSQSYHASPLKNCAKNIRIQLFVPDFQKMISLWCRKTLVSAGSAFHTHTAKTAKLPHRNCLPGETIFGGNQLSELSYCHLQEDRKDKSFF